MAALDWVADTSGWCVRLRSVHRVTPERLATLSPMGQATLRQIATRLSTGWSLTEIAKETRTSRPFIESIVAELGTSSSIQTETTSGTAQVFVTTRVYVDGAWREVCGNLKPHGV